MALCAGQNALTTFKSTSVFFKPIYNLRSVVQLLGETVINYSSGFYVFTHGKNFR